MACLAILLLVGTKVLKMAHIAKHTNRQLSSYNLVCLLSQEEYDTRVYLSSLSDSHSLTLNMIHFLVSTLNSERTQLQFHTSHI